MAGGGVAARLAGLVHRIFGVQLPVRVLAWDGSAAGPADAPTVVLRSKRVVRRLVWDQGELGMARAYVAGELDVDGDLADALRRCWRLASTVPRLTMADRLAVLRGGMALGALGRRPPPPAEEASMSGRPHSRRRDSAAIAHHYDLGNDFYALLLDDRLTYSCGYWTSADADYGVSHAQRDKLELICRKLALRPGMTLLDVGCGWGGLVLHAAARHGVRAVGITLSRQQADFTKARIGELGLGDAVEVRLADYRDIDGTPFDAVSSIEMGEHVGERNYPDFAARLRRLLRPGGRLLLQQMSRGANAPGGGPFVERYIAPDMHMRPLGRTVSLLEEAGFEVRDIEALREHYVRTVRAWSAQLEANWDEVLARVGVGWARVWRLYLAGGALAFEAGRIGVDQILAVRPTDTGAAVPAILSPTRREMCPDTTRDTPDAGAGAGAGAGAKPRAKTPSTAGG